MIFRVSSKLYVFLLLIVAENVCAFSLKQSLGLGDTLHKNRDAFVGKAACLLTTFPSHYPSFFSKIPEDMLFYCSFLKAKKIFWHAYNVVPAYKNFIDKECINGLPQNFSDIPATSKANYIKEYDISQVLAYGQFPKQGQIDTSTGTSGKPTKWIRGFQEMENVKYWIQIASEVALGDTPYIFCNMFALGPWATGITSTYALSGSQLVLSIGPDIEKLYDVLMEFGPEHRYVIAGYPPHMKKLVENAPFDLHKYDIKIVVGGESMSENVYNSIINHGIKAIYSSYGASDLRINIAQQTEFEQELQRLCKNDTLFKNELLGNDDRNPTFFHFNPLLDYIEETENQTLLFTDLDQSRVSPRVRYDVGDKGRILRVSYVTSVLKKHGYMITPKTNLPLLCLYGRGEDCLTFNGCKLMYDDLEYAIAKIQNLNDKVNRYAYNKFEDKNLDQQLEFWIELKKGVGIENIGLSLEDLNQQLINALCEVNQDFKAQIEYIKNNEDSRFSLPRTFLYFNGTSEMVEEDAHHKIKYIYNIGRN